MYDSQTKTKERGYMEPIKLNEKYSIKIKPIKPFNYLYTFWKPSHFYTGLEEHTKTCTWRTFRISRKLLVGAKIIKNNNDIDLIVFSNTDLSEHDLKKIIQRIVFSYGLNEQFDLEIKKEYPGKLRKLMRKFRGMRISCPESLYEMAIISLVLQNATINRTKQMFSNLLDNYGKVVEFDGRELKMFFSPEEMLDVSEDELKEVCRLGYRKKYIVPFSHFFISNSDEYLMSLPKEELLKKLQEIKGVGTYTSNVLASHVLRSRENVGLDSWNTKIIGSYLFDNEELSIDELYCLLEKNYGKDMGVICTYIIEEEYESHPANPLLSSDEN